MCRASFRWPTWLLRNRSGGLPLFFLGSRALGPAQCCEALWRLIETVVRGTLNVEAVGVLLKDSVTPPLAQALATVCAEQQGAWKADAIRGTVSVPKLQGVNWRVDVKTASSHAAGLGLPTVIMQLQVEPGRTVAFEMDKETLQAMLSGLGKIRDQLNRM